MTVWDILIALSGIDDYAVCVDQQRREVEIAKADDLPPTAKIIPFNANRWQRIHGAPH